jgi:hypothetical protein
MQSAQRGVRGPRSSPLESVTRAGLWIGAAGSVAFTIYTGRHNSSIVLMGLFVLWVLLPFAGLVMAVRAAEAARAGIGSAVRASALVIIICSLGLYGAVAMSTPGHHTAFAFLAVPGASWLAIVPMLIAVRLARRD